MQSNEEKVIIHCPGCGTEAALSQKFCRSCGFSLERIPQLLAEQRSTPESSSEIEKLQTRQRRIEQALSVAGVSFGAVVVLSCLTGIIYLVAVGSMPLVPGIILVLLILIGILAGSLGLYSERLKKTLSGSQQPRIPALVDSQPSFEAREGQFVSVTERTTNLLETNLDKREKSSEPERSD
jgi:hypothetical protein